MIFPNFNFKCENVPQDLISYCKKKLFDQSAQIQNID